MERWYKTLKGDCIRVTVPLSLDDARRIVADFVGFPVPHNESSRPLRSGRKSLLTGIPAPGDHPRNGSSQAVRQKFLYSCGKITFTAAEQTMHAHREPPSRRPAMSRASSSRSLSRKADRPADRTTNGSGEKTSVHMCNLAGDVHGRAALDGSRPEGLPVVRLDARLHAGGDKRGLLQVALQTIVQVLDQAVEIAASQGLFSKSATGLVPPARAPGHGPP